MNEQGSCYKCLCELFNIFWCFRVENWYDNSVSINSIFIDKIDNPNSNIDNYRLLTPNSFIEFYRISKKLIDFYRLLSNVIDYWYYQMTMPGDTTTEHSPLKSSEKGIWWHLIGFFKPHFILDLWMIILLHLWNRRALIFVFFAWYG